MKRTAIFCVVFPEVLDAHLLPLKMKCDQLEISQQIGDKRPVYYFSVVPTDNEFTITEKTLKSWINQQGTSTFFDKLSDEYKNWKRLLYSNKPDSIILAITITNQDYRPVPSIFSLWLVLALFHHEKPVKLFARTMLLQFVTQEKIPEIKVTGLDFTKDYLTDQNNTFNQYYDLNYLHFWAVKLIKNYPFSERTLRISSKNFLRIFLLPKQSSFFINTLQLEVKLAPGGYLNFLKFFINRFSKLNEIKIYSEKLYLIKPKELKFLNQRYLHLKNCELPSYLPDLPVLDKVKTLSLVSRNKINFSDHLFTNLTRLRLKGTAIEKLNLTDRLLKIKRLVLCLTKQKNLPHQIYEMKNLMYLQITSSTVAPLSPKINHLENLKIVNLHETKFDRFPVEFMLAPNLQEIIGLSLPQDSQLGLDKYPDALAADSIIWEKGKNIMHFPYEFYLIKRLRHMNLQYQCISEINSKILKFKDLEELILSQNNFHYLPKALRYLSSLKILNLSANNIDHLPFEWMVHVQKNSIDLNLENNPITQLPVIPSDFQPKALLPSLGNIRLTKNNLENPSARLLRQYQKIFGQFFITLI